MADCLEILKEPVILKRSSAEGIHVIQPLSNYFLYTSHLCLQASHSLGSRWQSNLRHCSMGIVPLGGGSSSIGLVLASGTMKLIPTATACSTQSPACKPTVLVSTGLHVAEGLMGS
jgi:hypothetical protein